MTKDELIQELDEAQKGLLVIDEKISQAIIELADMNREKRNILSRIEGLEYDLQE